MTAPEPNVALDVPAVENQNARFAIEGCIEYGRQGVNPPPDDHWLAPFWNMGKQLSTLAAALAEADSEVKHEREGYETAQAYAIEADRWRERAEKAEADAQACREQIDDMLKEIMATRAALAAAVRREREAIELLRQAREYTTKYNAIRGPAARSFPDGNPENAIQVQSGPRPTGES